MFYYPAVVQHRAGCFSTIWLVATKSIKGVSRRDILNVNVISTCEEILNYVLERVPPPKPGLPRPRFSLYLSSQLLYGLILVYHRQCTIHLGEIHRIRDKLVKESTPLKIDMDDHRRAPVLRDALSLQEETGGALDPFFGVLEHVMPSPSALIRMSEEHLREYEGTGITASPASITLSEIEPTTVPTEEFDGEELADQYEDTLALLMVERDHFPDRELERQREVTPREQERPKERKRERYEEERPEEGRPEERRPEERRPEERRPEERRPEEERPEEERPEERKPEEERPEERKPEERKPEERKPEEERPEELPVSTPELQPVTLPSEDVPVLPQEESGLPVEEPGPPPDQISPVRRTPPERKKKKSPRSKAAPRPKEKGPKKQLIFFDAETQLSSEALQRQTDDPRTETKREIPLPSSRRKAAELLDNPCTFLPEEILSLWRQAAMITPVAGSDLQVGERGPDSIESEMESELEKLAEAKREVDGDRMESEMYDDMTGVVDGFQESAAAEELPELLPEVAVGAPVPMTFRSLLSPDANRRTVSAMFHALLHEASARRVRVAQRRPYADILIWPRTQ